MTGALEAVPDGHEPVILIGKVTPLRRKSSFKRTSTSVIMQTVYPPLRWVVEGYLTPGLVVLAGRQKLGKTWLAIDIAVAVASGGLAMGAIPCSQGCVLYIDMENGPARIQRRLNTIAPDAERAEWALHLEWQTDAPPLDKGFIPMLDLWRLSVAHPRLVVVDVLQRVKPAGKAGQNSYESDYSIMAELQQWATENQIVVLVLHHTRKGGADDPLEALSGSNGLSACADATLVLDRSSAGLTLYVRGRDVEERESALQFNGGLWTVIGNAADVRRSDERGQIIRALEEADEDMSPTDIADGTGMKNNNVRKLLAQMVKAGEVTKRGRGSYGPVSPPPSRDDE